MLHLWQFKLDPRETDIEGDVAIICDESVLTHSAAPGLCPLVDVGSAAQGQP